MLVLWFYYSTFGKNCQQKKKQNMGKIDFSVKQNEWNIVNGDPIEKMCPKGWHEGISDNFWHLGHVFNLSQRLL